ncbi:hypothetical protein LJR255_003543 [Pararhizobium sp. LjRoot255]|uniref:hypothetical protein n=1 Tax=Pararhizobium sp. LjRoot255 TaxID=3342298 RepID=UPI003ED04A1E
MTISGKQFKDMVIAPTSTFCDNGCKLTPILNRLNDRKRREVAVGPIAVGLLLMQDIRKRTQCSNPPPIDVGIFHHNRVRPKM